MRGETELSEADIGPGSLSSMLHGSYCLRASRIFDDARSRSEWTVISPPCARVISNGIVRLGCTSKLRCNNALLTRSDHLRGAARYTPVGATVNLGAIVLDTARYCRRMGERQVWDPAVAGRSDPQLVSLRPPTSPLAGGSRLRRNPGTVGRRLR
jgi:hypothetical protein